MYLYGVEYTSLNIYADQSDKERKIVFPWTKHLEMYHLDMAGQRLQPTVNRILKRKQQLLFIR